MRSHALLLLSGLCLGCADEHAGRGRASSSADAADAGDTGDTGATTREPEEPPTEPEEPDAFAALEEFLAAIREFTKSSCACVAEAGDFSSQEECVRSHQSVFGWRECAERGLATLDPGKVRRQLGCQTEEFYQRTECMNEVPCSAGTDHALVECQTITLGCAPLDGELVIALSEACTPHTPEGDVDQPE